MKIPFCTKTVFALSVLALAGCGGSAPSKAPEAKLTAQQFYAEFKNPSEGEGKYLGKIIEITGEADRVGFDAGEQFYVLFRGGDANGSVQCFFSRKVSPEMSQKIKSGQTLTVRGRCVNRVVHAALDDCILVQ